MSGSVAEVSRLFLKLGLIAFGGPAAHIALMREELVRRRKWVTDERFLDLVGMANLIPGPTSTEVSIYLGYVRAGVPGLLAAGVCFIVPAMLLVLALAALYVRYGATPTAAAAMYGITPVIIAIVAHALWALGRTAVKSAVLAIIGLAVLALALAGVNVLALLLGGGAVMMLLRAGSRRPAAVLAAVATVGAPAVTLGQTATPNVVVSLGTLFFTFLKIGAVLYGSGYVLLAFLRGDFVERLGWLTDRQLLDAVAVGQFTPGPVFTTATFIGYLVAGVPGALLATVAIFLPSFVFVAATYRLLPRIRGSRWLSAFLDGVNVAAVGLMAAVTWQLARAAIVDAVTALLAVVAGVLLLRARLNSAWLVLGGAAAGLLARRVLG
ncbi:MAG TPA: chromate efflux transporter [Methylomirabilota bacterium]|nr:chromate efflux transporter [Methylomirabilota bacterium]